MEDAPAAHVDIEQGDTIVAVDGLVVATTKDVTEAIASKPAGEVVVLDLKRTGEAIKVRVRLGERPEPTPRSDELAYDVEATQAGKLYVLGQDGIAYTIEPGQKVEQGQVLGQFADPQPVATSDGKEKYADLYYNYYQALKQATKQPEAPVLRVERSGLDKKLEGLTSEVESLRKQMKVLAEQVEKLGARLEK